MNYKVFIPAAGIGSRLGENFSKALVSIGHRPAICHIIDKFPKDIEIVVALGHCGNYIEQALNLLYPDRKITYRYIEPYQGEGSGLGLTLLQSYTQLQCPFIFCPCDTIVQQQIPEPEYNWMGYPDKKTVGYKQLIMGDYRSIKIKGNSFQTVTDICSKQAKGDYPYIGLAGIHDYEIFWQAMTNGEDVGSIESGEVFGLKYLINHKIRAHSFTWYDTGSKASLEETRKKIQSPIKANILPKKDEAIWFISREHLNSHVLKFSTDKNFITNRVKRANGYLDGYVPKIEESSENLYTYRMQPGEVLSNKINTTNFSLLLTHLKNFWNPTQLDNHIHNDVGTPEFLQSCQEFYKTKTEDRINKYFKTFEQIDQPEIINDIETPTLNEILSQLDWEWLCEGLPSERFHGDLHFENILLEERSNYSFFKFTFLDWRQDFGGLVKYGDIYYDLAKLNHGIIISHEIIDKNLFSHSVENNVVKFDFLRKNISVELERMFERFIIKEGYDYRKVQYLTYLIFLNIAALHHYPYGLLLFHLGKLGLWKLLQDDITEEHDKN